MPTKTPSPDAARDARPAGRDDVVPDQARARENRSVASWAARLGPYGPIIVLVIGVAAFSIASPQDYASLSNFQSIASEQAVLALVALGLTIPMICGQFDLSIGAILTIVGLVTAGLMARSGLPWPAAVAIGLALGVGIGLVNGILVAYVGINSFIATLGTFTVLGGIILWYSRGEIIFEGIPDEFVSLTRTELAGFQLPALYAVIVCGVLWWVLANTPFGRNLYAIGGNRAAAEITGVAVKRHIVYSLVASGALCAVAGIVLTSRTASASGTAGDTFLLPAFAAAFIGGSTFRRGEFNVLGTFVGVYLIAAIVSGAFTVGAASYVSPIISGVALLLAVAGTRALAASR
ncbi:MAG: ABC transporter permease [Solirubrobacterales bacterium]